MWRWAIPRVCVLCGGRSDQPYDCCGPCEASLPVIEERCLRCGLPLTRTTVCCNRCLLARPAFDCVWPAYRLEPPIGGWIEAFKHREDSAAGHLIACLMARRLASMATPRPDVMMPIPTHWSRYWIRGIDVTQTLARELSAQLGQLPVADWMRLRRRTRAHIRLPMEKRPSNVHGAFSLKPLPSSTRFVALIDDTMASGATVHEAARLLKAQGVVRVDVWVVARA